jgi:hypothetical protein
MPLDGDGALTGSGTLKEETMNAAPVAPAPAQSPSRRAPRRELDLPAVVLVSWGVAGGTLLGGAAVAVLVLTQQLSAHALIAASAVFYMIGAAAGLLHGALLGVFGRPETTTVRRALSSMLHGLIYLVPLLLLGWLTAGWAAALPIVLRGRHLVAGAVTVGAWIATLTAVAVAASAGLEAARHAYRRWPDRVPGSLLVGATLVSLVVAFLIEPPVVWFVNVQLTGFGALLFALVLTFWFYGPIITTGLALLRRLRPVVPARPAGMTWRRTLARAGAVALVTIVVAALAVPFHRGVVGLPTDVERLGVWTAMALAVSTAVTDELLLRLFLFTAVFLLAARRIGSYRYAPYVAVAVAAAADLLMHASALGSLGLPGSGVVAAYLVARFAIPAVLFGYLFWRRGLGTTVTAHATANMAVGMLAF